MCDKNGAAVVGAILLDWPPLSRKESLTLFAAIEYFGCIYVDAENFDHYRDRVAGRDYARARMAESASV
jgi:hypothetical protein